MERNIMIHYLRNPYGTDELEMRKARRQAADELERLYKIERCVEKLIESIKPENIIPPEVLLHHSV
jgi:hypothetical protein